MNVYKIKMNQQLYNTSHTQKQNKMNERDTYRKSIILIHEKKLKECMKH